MHRAAFLLSVLAATAPAATVFREHVVRDPGMGNRPASTILVPEGWTVEGGLTRPSPQLFQMAYLVDMKITAPDGRQVRFYPSFQFEYSMQAQQQPMTPTQSGRFYYPLPRSPGAWMSDLIRRYPAPDVSEARVVGEQPDPQATAKLRQQYAQMFQMIQQGRSLEMAGGPRMDFDTQAAWITLRYKEKGKDLEETVSLAWQAMTTTWNGAPFGGTWSVSTMTSLRGAPGTAYGDDPVLQAILRSPRPDPVWTQEMHKHYQAMARIQAKGAAQRRQQSFQAHQKRMNTLNEISDIMHQGWKKRSAIRDAGHARQIDQIHEVTPYQTPSGTTVKLPSFYDHVFTDGQGRYVLGNDALYDPNTDAAINQADWQRIQPQR